MSEYLKLYTPADIPEPVSMPCQRAYVHRVVLWRKVGPGPHPCHWCGVELAWVSRRQDAITADHLNGDKHDNDPANLRVSCQSCNSSRAKGTLDIRLPDRASEILAHSPIKTRFRCGHPLGYLVDLDNVYVVTSRGVTYTCLACHRASALRYWREHHPVAA